MKQFENDVFAKLKVEHELTGEDRSNPEYGYIAKEA
jgi:hypothetical protein